MLALGTAARMGAGETMASVLLSSSASSSALKFAAGAFLTSGPTAMDQIRFASSSASPSTAASTSSSQSSSQQQIMHGKEGAKARVDGSRSNPEGGKLSSDQSAYGKQLGRGRGGEGSRGGGGGGGGGGGHDSARWGESRPPQRPPPSSSQYHPRGGLSLAMMNAPKKVFSLIGDPRTGLADDVTSGGVFGDLTVDMIHHQLSNEVYWYRYEFAGNVLSEAHRDARLSEHAKNLMYVLRARDPARWTVGALARKFRVRRQRVLAILALREVEAHRMEAGQGVGSGPLSAYACPVYLGDVSLDSLTGEPRDGGKEAAVSGALRRTQARHRIENQGPLLRRLTGQVQAELLKSLEPLAYSLEELRRQVDEQLSELQGRIQQMEGGSGSAPPPPGNEGGAGGAHKEGASPSPSSSDSTPPATAAQPVGAISGHLSSVRQQLDKISELTQRLFNPKGQGQDKEGSPPTSSSSSSSLEQERVLVATLATLTGELSSKREGQGVEGVASPSEAVARLLEGWEGPRLLRLVASLQKPLRKRLLDSAQRVAVDLVSQGVDLEALISSDTYLHDPNPSPTLSAGSTSSSAAAAAAATGGVAHQRTITEDPSLSPLPYDVFGFQPVSEDMMGELTSALGALEGDLAALEKLSQSPPSSSSSSPLPHHHQSTKAGAGQGQGQGGGAAAKAATKKQKPGGSSSHPAPFSSSSGMMMGAADLRELLRLRRAYLSADMMVGDLQKQQDDAAGAQQQGVRGGEMPPRRRVRLQNSDWGQMTRVLTEADPSYVSRVGKYEEIMALLASDPASASNRAVALLGLQELEGGGEERARAVLQAMVGDKCAPNPPLDPTMTLKKGESISSLSSGASSGTSSSSSSSFPSKLHKGSWDLISAFVDARVAQKVYHRGSGERHLVRLPSYPSFEGHSLEEFDQAEEGEMSRLHREMAKEEEEELLRRFQSGLLFNLGLVGPDLWDASRPVPEPNLATKLDRPIVVYDIGAQAETLYPPLKVVEAGGKERLLNEQERVYQERRLPLRSLPYQLQRIRRKPDL